MSISTQYADRYEYADSQRNQPVYVNKPIYKTCVTGINQGSNHVAYYHAYTGDYLQA